MNELQDKMSEDCAVHIDGDQIAFQSSAAVEIRSVEVVHKKSKRRMKFKNRTEFYGRSRNSVGGWLGDLNAKNEAVGKLLFSKEDFEIIDIRDAPEISYALQAVKSKIHGITNHLHCNQYTTPVGTGETFRHKLILPAEYKGNRDEVKPVHLKDCKEYLAVKHNGQWIENIEVDDHLTKLQYKGWKNYQRTGKITDIVASIDKDSLHTSGFLFNFNKSDGKLLHPEVIVIDDSIGNIWNDGKKGIKAWGSYWMAYQLLIGDSTDNIQPYQKFDIKYGEKTFYKEVSDIRSQAELFSFVRDKYQTWFTNGVSFTAWNGEQVEISSDKWLETIFKLVYMHRVDNDPTTFHKMLDFYKRKEGL